MQFLTTKTNIFNFWRSFDNIKDSSKMKNVKYWTIHSFSITFKKDKIKMNEITIYWNKIILWQIYSLDIDENIVLQSYQQSRHMTGCHGFVCDLTMLLMCCTINHWVHGAFSECYYWVSLHLFFLISFVVELIIPCSINKVKVIFQKEQECWNK